ncbi:MAG: SUMF1/EgtB/PvdO family nonheme iron enzyme [Myxococcales bacterium]|nr:SUMF1/EgtB/PvdO family nonheme iron enzyme [Myxococcales bacterium]
MAETARRGERWALLGAVAAGLGLAALLMRPPASDPAPTAVEPAVPAVTPTPSPTTASVAPVPAPAPPPSPTPVTGKDALCPLGMILVEGRFCPFVAHRCERWLGEPPPDRSPEEGRCERYHDRLLCEGRPSAHSFCIDRYEYPGRVGMKPAVRVSYREAEEACEAEGKRICAADEWMLACEGQATLPYPTGLERDASACNLDRRPRRPDGAALAEPHDVSVEVERLDQRMPIGALPRCKSPFGVMDMSGNVAEWVHNRQARRGERRTAIAGGAWGQAAATCRALDVSHGPEHRHYDLGFRCCASPLDGRASRRLMPKDYRLPKRRAIVGDG